MKRTSLMMLISLLVILNVAWAGNWYVRPAQQGSNDGTNWNNAWATSTINWASVQPGDTVWLAGGTYTTKLTASKSGTSGTRIYLRRVLVTNSVPASAAGWSSGFDSQVSFQVPFGGTNNESQLALTGDYITVDGQMASGILFTLPANPGGQKINAVMMSGNYGVLQYIEAAGPGYNANHNGTPRMVAIYGTNNVSRYNYGHGLTQPYTLYGSGVADNIIEYDRITDNGSADNATYHDDMMEYGGGATRLTIRYCYWDHWKAEGVMMWNGAGSLYVYGNIFKNSGVGTIWPSRTGQTSAGPVYFCNNTLINAIASIDQSASAMSSWAPGSQARNNVYWGSTMWNGSWGGWPMSDWDYDFGASASMGGPGAHSITTGLNPFVDYNGGDYHIIATIGANYPRNKGVALPAPYNMDRDGNIRGSDGTWDIGAYEYTVTGMWTLRPGSGQAAECGMRNGSVTLPVLPNPLAAARLQSYLQARNNLLVFDLVGQMVTQDDLIQPGIYLVVGKEGKTFQKILVER
jgi:hypothetical protein